MNSRQPRNARITLLIAGLSFMMAGVLSYLPAAAQEITSSSDLREEITDINGEVKKKRNDIVELNRKAEQFKSSIAQKKIESASLEDQLALLDNRIAKTRLGIEIAKDEIRLLELDIAAIEAKMKDKEKQIGREKTLLGSLARKLYRRNFRRSTFEILLSHRSFSEFFDDVHAIIELQSGVKKALTEVRNLQRQLGEEKADREKKQLAIAEKKRELEVAKSELEDERALKDAILIETKASELEYRYLLAELKQEQNEADSEILYLERVLREKLTIADRLSGDRSVLSWPVVPARGLSTRFHDPEYPFRYIFEHPGIDIRAGQGTAVRASAAGIVARAKNAGMGYSYVMLIHNNDMSTVYGHLTKITVREDTFVERGEIVGYSGGMPGTPGAGRMTTGPHLHFESRLRGIPVDPLAHLLPF